MNVMSAEEDIGETIDEPFDDGELGEDEREQLNRHRTRNEEAVNVENEWPYFHFSWEDFLPVKKKVQLRYYRLRVETVLWGIFVKSFNVNIEQNKLKPWQ